MGCSRSSADEAGFATPAATVISLAIALMATAVATRSSGELVAARRDMERLQGEYATAGAAEAAVLVVMSSRNQGRMAWDQQTPAGPMSTLAEPEAPKLSLVEAAKLDDAGLRQLGATDPERVRRTLRALALSRRSPGPELEAADPSAAWRSCARSAISAQGAATGLELGKAGEPAPGPLAWRVGGVWRIRVQSAAGWTEDRLVRFTGDRRRPAAVVGRRFWRSGVGGDETCQLEIKRA